MRYHRAHVWKYLLSQKKMCNPMRNLSIARQMGQNAPVGRVYHVHVNYTKYNSMYIYIYIYDTQNDICFMRYLAIMLISLPIIISLLCVPWWSKHDLWGWLHDINHLIYHFQLYILIHTCHQCHHYCRLRVFDQCFCWPSINNQISLLTETSPPLCD